MKTDFTTVEFDIKPSKYLTLFVICLHLLAVFAVINTHLAGMIQILLGLLVVLHFYGYRRHDRIQPKPQKLIYNESLGWQLVTNQSVEMIEIQPSTIATTFLIIVHYRISLANQSLQSLVCFKDALSSREFKQLLVQLKISGLQDNHPEA